MIQAFGLTSNPRKGLPPAVDDVSFDARAGHVTALLGAAGAGKSTVLRLMLELQQGRGLTHFRGRPLHRIAHPSREVGVLLGDVPGHPGRTVRGHLRMLCAAAGVPVRRADEVLEAVGLVSLRDERLGALSRGMDRRLGLACALLADPHTLVLDDPADGLSARESRWLHGMLRAHATQGGTVLVSTADPKEAARIADRVVTLDGGRVAADQAAGDFARTRLRPRVAVRTPHAARLAALLTKEARTGQRSVEVAREGGNRLYVYGSTCAAVGDAAFRYGILVHQLADEVGDMGPGAGEPAPSAPGAVEGRGPAGSGSGAEGADRPARAEAAAEAEANAPHEVRADASQDCDTASHVPSEAPSATAETSTADTSTTDPAAADTSPAAPPPATPHPTSSRPSPPPSHSAGPLPDLPPPISVRPAPSPLRPLRYELRRATGVGAGFLTGAVVLGVSALTAAVLARIGHTPQARLLAAWPRELPLPPAALGAGLLGALAFGDEFRHPALAADRGTVPRRLGLLAAKLLVSAATGLVLAVLTVGCDAEVLYLLYGRELVEVPVDWLSLGVSWIALVIGCAWAGVLAAGVFRSTAGGLAAVVAVPVVVVPLVRKLLEGPSVRSAAGFPLRLREVLLSQWPFGGERYVSAVARVIGQPVGSALTLSLVTLLCAYLLATLRRRAR
ncbi:ATP-binding cassette domain-containing protein [Streptomyces sp.]|uniref:ABC transporter ATP-binding protein n=1 Tax=Streptomyces sp. TaxID=1931 RepID=UPI002D5F6685|nr:ATP-binding cassette domain-containing protein [Streptomyces sp.]HZF89492.1 ATP-binding cassette domain-containing protein [Streptomyces sp.]